MSENLNSENENNVTETLTAESAAAPAPTASAPDAATVQQDEKTETEAVASAVVKIEGQEFPLPVSVAANDELLKAALSPHYPSMEASISPIKEGLDQLNSTIYEAAKEMAERLNDSKFVAGGTAKKAREMYRWFKLMNFTGDTEVETVLAELNKIASRDAKTRTAAEMKEAVDAVIIATSKRARKLLKTEQLDALEF